MASEQTVFPSLIVDRGVAALEFYVRAFGARELYRLTYADGRIAHAELEIAGNVVQVADEHPSLELFGPRKLAGVSCSLAFYVDDVDRVVAQAVAEGAEIERPIQDEFYGDRVGWLRDPFGHRWSVHTRRERLTNEEIQARFADLMRGKDS
jgi:PhnB protein